MLLTFHCEYYNITACCMFKQSPVTLIELYIYIFFFFYIYLLCVCISVCNVCRSVCMYYVCMYVDIYFFYLCMHACIGMYICR